MAVHNVVEISVAAGAFEVKFVVYKIESNAVLLARENSTVLVTPGKMHIEIAEICKFIPQLFFDIRIKRNNHSHVELARCRKRLRKRAYNLRQAARCNKGRRFGSYKKYFFLLLRFCRGFLYRSLRCGFRRCFCRGVCCFPVSHISSFSLI